MEKEKNSRMSRLGSRLGSWLGFCRCMLHEPLSLWAPLVGAATFALCVPLSLWWEGAEPARALAKGAVYGAVVAFCWLMGVFCCCQPDPEEADEEEDEPAWMLRLPQWLRRGVGWLLLAGVLLLCCTPQLEGWIEGSCSAARALIGILLKALAAGAVVLPSLLQRG